MDQMERRNHFSWNIVMSAQLQLDHSGERAKRTFDRMPMWDVVSRNVMIAAFAQGGKPEQAAQLFQACGDGGRDRVSWNAIIAAHSRCSSTARRALELFSLMDAQGDYHPPDVFTLVSAFEASSSSSSSSSSLFLRVFGRALHQEVAELGISDVAVGNSLVTMYGAWRSSSSAKAVFDGLSGRDVVSWNAMLAALVSSEEMDLAVEAWHKMACHNLVSWNAVIAVCSRRGDLAAALSVFEWMPDRDLVSWNAILSACVQNGENEQALELWERMQQDAVKADKITLTTLLDACANLGLDALGASLLQCTIKWNSGEPDVVVANAVLNFHVRCGNVSDAKAVFETIKYRRDVVSWSSMVAAVHDDVAEALDLLRLMLLDGVAPNKITSLGVLSVCSHAGALDAGCSFFLSLEADYHTRLALEHYICMIDLVGRAGNFDGAQELMHSMPFEADNVAWRILMAAYLQYYSA
ncbi:pentatricopeptide repeat-containing protein At4g02750 isoform X3 [Selaginella moellendorffii]|uniref:pentatricopeptide repeat-containing protein At4g02750 isoform X2 n=1 Tax=Selaginella moellendorffii TaxID=88036 RepID=UPI000D1C6F36|nr:pentatricopeptide repeat-containing protein At4g02750 isoform X2 [Selaginella moellendorffii]XP_024530663.1 pentatricopeptide repeat-containing protein At4g02750 isoform X3 [Selaginella moellendorffii]|eukprot:XP_024530662.1 pentatricopeptide repeat-containing protein At4g02750 isoform X2 [Selaginella moellendorffii]